MGDLVSNGWYETSKKWHWVKDQRTSCGLTFNSNWKKVGESWVLIPENLCQKCMKKVGWTR